MIPNFKPETPEEKDISYVLHANTNAIKHQEIGPTIIERGDGVYVIDNHGRRYLEAVAGLWSVGVGFSEKRLVDAAAKQMSILPWYHTMAHRATLPSIELAEKLIDMAPCAMSKVFFTSSGSEANDTVMKFLWYRSNAIGQPQRKKFIVRNRAYHGVTAATVCLTSAAVSSTDVPLNHQSFDLVVLDVIRVTCPDSYQERRPGESEEAFATRLADELEQRIIEAGPETICAFFGEPLMAGAGAIVPPATYWEKIQKVLRKYDILLVIDEVVTGFGRTGRMFGCETFGITPDVLVLSKQLSSSYLPIAAILFNEKAVGPIVEQSGRIGTLAHGFTAGGHPVCAAVALENIRIIEEDGLVENSAAMGDRLLSGLRALESHPFVAEVRGAGLVAAVQLATDKARRIALDPPGRLATMVHEQMNERGVLARTCGDAITFAPPMIINAEEIDQILDCLAQSLDAVQQILDQKIT
ncbi:MAG: aminotransferase [Sphingomonas bacterium]